MALPFFVQAQPYLTLKGTTYKSQTELTELLNCRQVEAKVDLDRYICRIYYDTITNKHIIVAEKETRDGNEDTYTILDVAEFGPLAPKQHLFVGSPEGNHDSTHRFVIAIDCCYIINKAEDWPDVSTRMYLAWGINKQTNKIDKLKGRKVMRVHEGFYWK